MLCLIDGAGRTGGTAKIHRSQAVPEALPLSSLPRVRYLEVTDFLPVPAENQL
jgi:hypothetical protein